MATRNPKAFPTVWHGQKKPLENWISTTVPSTGEFTGFLNHQRVCFTKIQLQELILFLGGKGMRPEVGCCLLMIFGYFRHLSSAEFVRIFGELKL